MTFPLSLVIAWGGVISHDLGLKFTSPTINMFFSANDFIKFISDFERYINTPMIDISNEIDKWPTAKLDDIKLELVHYKNVEEAQEAWDRRKDRINYKNMFIMFNDRNGFTEKELQCFQKLEFENKVCFVSDQELTKKYDCTYYISRKEPKLTINGRSEVYTLTAYKPKIGFHRVIDEFDYISWFNGMSLKEIRSKNNDSEC